MTERRLLGHATEPYRTWQTLLRAIIDDTDQSLPHALQRIARSAREIVGCRYAVVAVVDETGALEHLVPAGDDPAAVQPIGRRPLREGLLGTVIADARIVRLPAAGVDAAAVGLPADHPAANSLLGVPIHCDTHTVAGALYLSEPEDGQPFHVEHEYAAELVATAAAAVVKRARFAAAARHRERWLAGAAELVRILLGGGPQDPFRLLAERALPIAQADLVAVLTTGAGTASSHDSYQIIDVVDVAGSTATAARLAGQLVHRSWLANSAALEAGQPYAYVTDPHTPLAELSGSEAVLLVPMRGSAGEHAVLAAFRRAGRPAFTAAEAAAGAAFAAQVAPAFDAAGQSAHRDRAVLLSERDRIARDLHDHVIQRLFAIGLTLQGAGTQADPDTARRLVASVEDLDSTIAQIRATIYRLAGPVLPGESSVRARIGQLIAELEPVLGFRADLEVRGPMDFSLDNELADDCVAVIREALTNVARHARADRVTVTATATSTELAIEVTDNGRGLGAGSRRSGLANLRTRAERRGGRLTVTSSRSRGTAVCWRVPLGNGVGEARSAG